MLGFVGFTIAAVIVSIFALSFYKSFPGLDQQRRSSFASAFLLLGVALFVWGFAPLLNDPLTTKFLVLTGDVLLLIGTGYLIRAQFTKYPIVLFAILALIGALAIGLRAFVFEPAAFVQDGLLHFNLEGAPRMVLIATFAFIWMPLGTRITQLAVRSRNVPQFSGAIALLFITSLVCAALFIAARQHAMIIATFTALTFTFLLLALLPVLINKYSRLVHAPVNEKKEVRHGK